MKITELKAKKAFGNLEELVTNCKWKFCTGKYNNKIIDKIPELIEKNGRFIWYTRQSNYIRLWCINEKDVMLSYGATIFILFKEKEKEIIKQILGGK